MKEKTIIALVVVLVLVGSLVIYSKRPSVTVTPDYVTPVVNNGNGGSENKAICKLKPSGLVGVANSETLGDYLTDGKCMTLYTTTKDKPQESTCYNDCAKLWIPYVNNGVDTKGNGDGINNLERKDKTVQFSIGEQPLYYYKGDTKAGDTTGAGVGKVWFVVPVRAAN